MGDPEERLGTEVFAPCRDPKVPGRLARELKLVFHLEAGEIGLSSQASESGNPGNQFTVIVTVIHSFVGCTSNPACTPYTGQSNVPVN